MMDALKQLVEAADSGEWHSSEDCRIEGRQQDCRLCQALARARAPRPIVVCLCGSTRFYDVFQWANYQETMKGKIVLSVGFYPHSTNQAHGEDIGCTPEQKEALDQLHLRKIDLADEVFILNVNGYIGESTRRELRYALDHGKTVRFLEDRPQPSLPAGTKEDFRELLDILQDVEGEY